jgi:hypothetical protein
VRESEGERVEGADDYVEGEPQEKEPACPGGASEEKDASNDGAEPDEEDGDRRTIVCGVKEMNGGADDAGEDEEVGEKGNLDGPGCGHEMRFSIESERRPGLAGPPNTQAEAYAIGLCG